MHKISIVIPCYNEQETIKKILDKVKEITLPAGWGKDIIVIDDGSKDNSRNILEEMQNGITVIFKEKHEGKGAALKEGFKVSCGDYILIQDADLEYDPKNHIKLINALNQGTSIVFGSRMLERNNTYYSMAFIYGCKLVTKIFNMLFGTKFTDIATCYKLFPRSIVPELICLKSNDFVFDMVELPHQLSIGNSIVEVPVAYTARSKKEGKKLKWHQGVKGLLTMLRIKFNQVYLRKNSR